MLVKTGYVHLWSAKTFFILFDNYTGVALLPFVDETRLLAAVRPLYDDLTDEEKQRAVKGSDRLFVSKWHPAFDFFTALYNGIEEADDDEVVCVLL